MSEDKFDTEELEEQSAAEEEAELSLSEKKKLEKAKKAEERKRKKEVAKLKKEYLERQKIVPQNRKPLVCPPDKAGKSTKTILIGFALRALVIAAAVFSVTFFAVDAFGLAEETAGNFGAGSILGWSVLLTLILAASSVLKPRAAFASGGVLILCGITAIKLLPDPVGSIINGGKATFNAALDHLTSVGYLAMGEKKVELNVAAAEIPGLIRTIVFLFILFLSVVYTLCLIRRIRVWQLAVAGTVSAAILWLVFTYNITRSNWGVVLIIASFSALLVMFAYDTLYIRQTGPDKTDTEAASAAFNPEQGPEMPESLLKKSSRKAENEQKKAEKSEKKAKKKAEKKREISVDEELSDYFSVKETKAPKAKEPKKKLTPAEKKALKEEKKAKKAEKQKERRAVAAYYGFKSLCIDAKCAAGGFAGAGMFLLAMIMLIIPALATHDSFKTVDVIDKKFEYVREYVTAILMGDDPALDLLAYENNKNNFTERSTEPRALYYTGKVLMRVESNTRYNVYMRGWVATSYNDETGCWQTAAPGSDTLNTYRSLFGSSGTSVTDAAEHMMYSFYTLMDPTSIPSAEERDYSSKINSHTTEGYVVSQVNVKRVELSSKLLYMPSFYIRSCNVKQKTSAGKWSFFLRDYGSNDASNITYANFFDGIYTSYRASKDKDGYAVVSMIPTMKVSSFYTTMAKNIASFNEARAALLLGEREAVTVNGLPGYTIKLADGSSYTYYEEYRVYKTYIKPGIIGADGTVEQEPTETKVLEQADHLINDDGTVVWSDNNDGNRYIVLLRDFGNAVYTIKSDGSIRRSVENVPEDMKFDAEGNEKVYVAPEFPFIIRYYELMTDEQRGAFSFDCTVIDYYTTFVYSTYRTTSSSSIIKELTAKIIAEATETAYEEYEETDPETGEVYTLQRPVKVPADFSLAALSNEYRKDFSSGATNTKYELVSTVTNADVYKQRHKLVMEIINYLCDEKNYTYTLTPALTEDESLIGVEKFLAGTHEGSCVQYATALVLMLREAGIPARYVDGYVASGFNTNYSQDKVGSYTTNVKDSNAHAWVEVWYDDIGWVQYEATPVYYSSMYEQQGSSSTGGYTGGSTGDEEEEEPAHPEDILTEEELAELIRQQEAAARKAAIRKFIITTVIILAAAGLVFLVFFLFMRRAKKAQASRDNLIDKFASAGEKDKETPSREDVQKMYSLTELMLSECGLLPKTGEFRDEYAERLASFNPGALAQALKEEKLTEIQEIKCAMYTPEVSKMLDGYAAEEFGYGADVSSMPLMARFFKRMYAAEYSRHVSPVKRVWHWFVKTDL